MDLFFTGSLVEGQAHSRHFNNEPAPDIDIMIPYGEIDEQDELINAVLAPGFVYVKAQPPPKNLFLSPSIQP
jgi:hypothetical protein